MAETVKDEAKQVLTNVRCSYMNVHQPRESNGKTKYGIMLLIPKGDKKNEDKIDRAIAAVKKKCLATKFDGTEKGVKTTKRDGDNPEWASAETLGHWILNVSNLNKPMLQDEDGNPLMDATEMYSGCYCHVAVDFFGYKTQTQDGSWVKGISASFSLVRKAKDGERLDGRQNRDAEIAEASDMMEAALGN